MQNQAVLIAKYSQRNRSRRRDYHEQNDSKIKGDCNVILKTKITITAVAIAVYVFHLRYRRFPTRIGRPMRQAFFIEST